MAMKKLSEHARELARDQAHRNGQGVYSVGMPHALAALDSWQASVEEQLASMRNELDVMQFEPSPESERELLKSNELVRERFGDGDGGASVGVSGVLEPTESEKSAEQRSTTTGEQR